MTESLESEESVQGNLPRMPAPSRKANRISVWVVIGYIAALAAGLPGMIIGTLLVTARRRGPGVATYVFNERSRKHGKVILYFASIILVLSILFFMNWFFFEKILFGKRGNL